MQKHDRKFYGLATIGEKGQIVIPVKAREAMNLDKGDQLIAFGMGDEAVIFAKSSMLDKIALRLTDHLHEIQDISSKVNK
jgi:AbrB family looped-hinge helix DNA binding protein